MRDTAPTLTANKVIKAALMRGGNNCPLRRLSRNIDRSLARKILMIVVYCGNRRHLERSVDMFWMVLLMYAVDHPGNWQMVGLPMLWRTLPLTSSGRLVLGLTDLWCACFTGRYWRPKEQESKAARFRYSVRERPSLAPTDLMSWYVEDCEYDVTCLRKREVLHILITCLSS